MEVISSRRVFFSLTTVLKLFSQVITELEKLESFNVRGNKIDPRLAYIPHSEQRPLNNYTDSQHHGATVSAGHHQGATNTRHTVAAPGVTVATGKENVLQSAPPHTQGTQIMKPH